MLGGLPLFCLVLVPVGFGVATTGAGAVDVVTGAAAGVVVTGGAEDVVEAGAEWVVVAAGLGLCAGAFLC